MESLEMGGNEEGDISNNETPIHVVEDDINLEKRLFKSIYERFNIYSNS